ncbi:MAG TPA: type II secretion system F family protein [Gaiellaceae bacterium]|nr:type II secretion system F family protein [Gaiellaceae bacterium]
MRRVLALAASAALALPAAAGAAGRFAAVDTGSFPTVRATFVTPRPVERPPVLTENGGRVAGLEAVNLGRAKSVVLAVDRSRSMQGEALRDAAAAARAFVAAKPPQDRIALVAFGSRATTLTGFSTSTIDADGALRALAVDGRQGTALHDAVVAAAELLEEESLQARVIIVLTDGRDVSSSASMDDAIAAARAAGATVYPVAIEGPQFSPAPLRELARATGGRYAGASSSGALAGIYASIADELRRTWQLSYLTSARPGERIELAASGARTEVLLPGARTVASAEAPLPEEVFRFGPAVVPALVGLCVLLAVGLLVRVPAGEALRRRIQPHLGRRERKRARGPVKERFHTASAVLRATERAFGHLRWWHALHRLLERADVPLRTVELAYVCLGSGLLLGLVLAVAAMPSLVVLAGLAGGAWLPVGVVWFKARRRLAAVENELPDVLLTLAASLKAGHSFRQGIQAVVDEGNGPTSKEFKRVLTETSLGRPMDEALSEMAERVGSENLSFVVTAVTIQRQVGGSLAGIFDMVAEAVRNRQQFARKIRSLTAMGRMSAYVLVGLPFFIAGAVTLLNGEYMDPLYHTSVGQTLIGLGLGMMLVGSLVLKKIVSFRG